MGGCWSDRKAAGLPEPLARKRRSSDDPQHLTLLSMEETIMTLRDTFSTSESTVSSNPLIAGARVAGTEVYNTAGEHLGEIYDVMLDKKTGKVAYAIMSFGGFLGLGEKYHPIPWSVLDFDPDRGGYVVPMTKDKLEAAPMYDSQGEPDWDDRTYGKRVHDYYGTMPYWMM
jgi:hypothetical protein